MSYCFSRPYVKFQGHTALKIVEFDPNWAFPDSNSSLNSPMAMKCCTKLEKAKERCPIVFQGHPSNFKVTRYKTSPILTQIGRFRTIGRSQLSNPSDLPCLIIGDHFRLHFYNIRQCQLTISWVAMVTCGPIVFPKVLWMQHLRIIFDFNALDMMQIFKSIPMVSIPIDTKLKLPNIFYKWCFFYIYYQIENVNRKGIMWVKASEGTAMPCGFTRHPQHGMCKITIKVL